jgi:hypothetical protein
VDGKEGGIAVLVAYSAALMTVSKTLLYCKSYRVCLDIC